MSIAALQVKGISILGQLTGLWTAQGDFMERQLQPKPVSICGPSLGIVDAELLETSDSDSKLNTPGTHNACRQCSVFAVC